MEIADIESIEIGKQSGVVANVGNNAKLAMTRDDILAVCSALEYQSWNDRELTSDEIERIGCLIKTISYLAPNVLS